MRLVGDHVLKDGRRLGGVRLTGIDTAVTDALYERLLDHQGTQMRTEYEIEHERRTRDQSRDEIVPARLERGRCAAIQAKYLC